MFCSYRGSFEKGLPRYQSSALSEDPSGLLVRPMVLTLAVLVLEGNSGMRERVSLNWLRSSDVVSPTKLVVC